MDVREAIEALTLSKEFRQTDDENLRAKLLERKVANLMGGILNNPMLQNKSSLRDMLNNVDSALEFIFNDSKIHGVIFTNGMINSLADITALLHVNHENMGSIELKINEISSSGDNDDNNH